MTYPSDLVISCKTSFYSIPGKLLLSFWSKQSGGQRIPSAHLLGMARCSRRHRRRLHASRHIQLYNAFLQGKNSTITTAWYIRTLDGPKVYLLRKRNSKPLFADFSTLLGQNFRDDLFSASKSKNSRAFNSCSAIKEFVRKDDKTNTVHFFIGNSIFNLSLDLLTKFWKMSLKVA